MRIYFQIFFSLSLVQIVFAQSLFPYTLPDTTVDDAHSNIISPLVIKTNNENQNSMDGYYKKFK